MAEEKLFELVVIEGGRKDGGPPSDAGGEDGGPVPVFASEDALAAQLIDELGKRWRYASSGDWYKWNRLFWELDVTRLIRYRARLVCRRISKAIDLQSLARRVASTTTADNVVRAASADPKVSIRAEAFDMDPWILNTPSGIVDLHNGQLHPHDPARLITKCTGAAPLAEDTAGSGCPVWQQFLRDVTGRDEAFGNYLQRVAGYLLTGSIEEHAIFFVYGPGGTGKSTFQKVLSWLLGDYATTAMMDLFTVTQGERHPAELATLQGRRLVIAGEVDGAKRWDEAKLKAITGGDRITARFMRGDPFTFTPQFKLLLAGNDRPRMRGADDAMRRRFHVIPFKHKPLKVDKELDDKLFAELGGILSWAIKGEVKRRLAGGLNAPRIITEATDEYFQAENTIGRWIEERCVMGQEEFTLTRDLYRDFHSWAQLTGERAQSERVFSQRLGMLPEIVKEHRREGNGFRGVAPRASTGDLFGPRRNVADASPREPGEEG